MVNELRACWAGVRHGRSWIERPRHEKWIKVKTTNHQPAMAIIECIPNVSEGRRLDVVGALVGAVREVRGVRLLDVSSDAAHNRSVLTLAGDASALKAAVVVLVGEALGHIDLRAHKGEHPRLGAVDVVPFVPIEGATMADCVALARATGADIAQQFGLPVYLYEEAASTPLRRNLEDIRRGEFEALPNKMALPEWAPDFGPRQPHPTGGAVAVGARMPLIAFNVNLATDRLEVAKSIAAAVRHSSGGFRYVKAMGIALGDRGVVQVSMNLTNFERTPILRVFEAIEREAARYGVAVMESEIVGLVPAAALVAAAEHTLRLQRFSRDQILETRLRQE
jgi:glutamate formiminotransferase